MPEKPKRTATVSFVTYPEVRQQIREEALRAGKTPSAYLAEKAEARYARMRKGGDDA